MSRHNPEPRHTLARTRSVAFAILSAVIIEVTLVMFLVRVRFDVRPVASQPIRPRDAAISHITYVRLSSQAGTAIPRSFARSAVAIAPRERDGGLRQHTSAEPMVRTPAIVRSESQRSIKWGVDSKIAAPNPSESSAQSLVDSMIRAGIKPGNDSLIRAQRTRENAVDWTIAVSGKKYGMSPGRVYLGGLTLRFPLVFAEPLSLSSDRRREKQRVVEDTRAHAARAIRDAMFDSAVAGIARRRTVELRRVPD
jgi:hypothetical protein